MAALKVSILGPQVVENWGFSPLNFLGARMNTPIGDRLFQEYRVVWKSFAKIGPGTSKNHWTEKKKKISRPK